MNEYCHCLRDRATRRTSMTPSWDPTRPGTLACDDCGLPTSLATDMADIATSRLQRLDPSS
jgi:hypothetical protein